MQQPKERRSFIYCDLNSFPVTYKENSDRAIHCMTTHLKSMASVHGKPIQLHAHLTEWNLLAPGQLSQLKQGLKKHKAELHCLPSQDAMDKHILLNQPAWSGENEGESPQDTTIVLATKRDVTGLTAKIRSFGSKVITIADIPASVVAAPATTATLVGSRASGSGMSTSSTQSDTRIGSGSGSSSSTVSNVMVLWDYVDCPIPAVERKKDDGCSLMRRFNSFISSKFGGIASFCAYVTNIEDANSIRDMMKKARVDLRCVEHGSTLDGPVSHNITVDAAYAIRKHTQIRKVILICKDRRFRILCHKIINHGLGLVRIPTMYPNTGAAEGTGMLCTSSDYEWTYHCEEGDVSDPNPAAGRNSGAPSRNEDDQDNEVDELEPGFKAPSGSGMARGDKDVARESTGDDEDEYEDEDEMGVDTESEHPGPSRSRSASSGSMFVLEDTEESDEDDERQASGSGKEKDRVEEVSGWSCLSHL